MKLAHSGKPKRLVEEINITPLTDVFLVLLVIMMVVAPLSRRVQSDIRPPEIVSGQPGSQEDMIIEIGKDGQYLVDGAAVPQGQLRTVLERASAQTGQKQAALRADRTVKSRWILDAMAEAQAAGFERLTVIGSAQEDPKQKDETAP
ncbi:MAG: biopolymer transporter ExbD [Candidatus Hydrogenedentes bacterium]|nr:biopolymer transporter ExbD [Candidatus Hydrogenedentota bacterium]